MYVQISISYVFGVKFADAFNKLKRVTTTTTTTTTLLVHIPRIKVYKNKF